MSFVGMRCDRVKRLHRADAPPLQLIVIAVPADADRASPGRVPRAALIAEEGHQVIDGLRGLTSFKIRQLVPYAMDLFHGRGSKALRARVAVQKFAPLSSELLKL